MKKKDPVPAGQNQYALLKTQVHHRRFVHQPNPMITRFIHCSAIEPSFSDEVKVVGCYKKPYERRKVMEQKMQKN